jgi:dTDP-4-dehydrorhamnose 3,5-epimerase
MTTGAFSRAFFCQREFEALDLTTEFVQANMTYSAEKGTLRGLHYQIRPHKEVKLVHCPRGAIFDVVIDMRPDSPTYLEWISVELTAENRKNALHPRRICPRLPDAGRRHRSVLPGGPVLRARL